MRWAPASASDWASGSGVGVGVGVGVRRRRGRREPAVGVGAASGTGVGDRASASASGSEWDSASALGDGCRGRRRRSARRRRGRRRRRSGHRRSREVLRGRHGEDDEVGQVVVRVGAVAERRRRAAARCSSPRPARARSMPSTKAFVASPQPTASIGRAADRRAGRRAPPVAANPPVYVASASGRVGPGGVRDEEVAARLEDRRCRPGGLPRDRRAGRGRVDELEPDQVDARPDRRS